MKNTIKNMFFHAWSFEISYLNFANVMGIFVWTRENKKEKQIFQLVIQVTKHFFFILINHV